MVDTISSLKLFSQRDGIKRYSYPLASFLTVPKWLCYFQKRYDIDRSEPDIAKFDHKIIQEHAEYIDHLEIPMPIQNEKTSS